MRLFVRWHPARVLALPLLIALTVTVLGQLAGPASAQPAQARTVETIPAARGNALYIGNRAPLLPSSLMKLPIGSITPKGWLRSQLELEAEGMIGHLPEISKWCKFEGNAWADPKGEGHSGWEELPYWLKGYGDLGYVLKDEAIIKAARRWIDAGLASQEPDGWFGPRSLKTSLKGKPDLWPHMVMCNVLQSFDEYSGDRRVLPFLTGYLNWLKGQPDENFGAGYWPRIRFGDTIETIYWVYNRSGEPWLLELAERIHRNMQDWTSGVHNWHNVNIAQGFREPGVYYQQGGHAQLLQAADRNYQTVMESYGQFPGGGFAGDENCRPGFTDPRQGFETCGMVEFMHSFQMLTKISGAPLWADRCEEMAFNSLPASMTPDLKALHYLTSPNQVQLDAGNKAPAIQNSGTMFSYSPFEVYRCCQHNVSHGWPYYAEELWLATADGGLCASLYAASEVSAKVAEGASVRISEETDYPFSETVLFRLSLGKATKFPLYLRIPKWCASASVKVNGQRVRVQPAPLSYLVLEREWKDKDTVTLQLPMEISVRWWAKNNDAVSVDLGPLTFSLKIEERWTRYGGTDGFPEHEVFPAGPWNYGLVLDAKNPARSFQVIRKNRPLPAQPFTPGSAPVELRAKAKRIPAWKQDPQGLVGELRPSPVKSDQPVEKITLIPMGAARLRVSAFPVIGNGTAAHEWTLPEALPVTASHCFENDTVEALIDGQEPKNSNDHTIPRFTWWPRRGSTEWVQQDFKSPRRVSAVDVYWFDDSGGGNCRVPESWRVFYKVGESWKEVEGSAGYGIAKDGYNTVSFTPVQTLALKLEAKLQPNFSGGILEWKVKE
jgi:hypothetical protein